MPNRAVSSYHFKDIFTTILGRGFVIISSGIFTDQDVKCSCFNGNAPLELQYHPLARYVSTAFVVVAYRETAITYGLETYDYISNDVVFA